MKEESAGFGEGANVEHDLLIRYEPPAKERVRVSQTPARAPPTSQSPGEPKDNSVSDSLILLDENF